MYFPHRCSKNAFSFGVNLERNFHCRYQQIKFPDEIKQFTALVNAFNDSPKSSAAYIYHGSFCQVSFSGFPGLTRQNPRCELADVLFISYTDKELRISFLQAKSVCTSRPFPLVIANTEQYAVLSKRPPITKWFGQELNKDILSGAFLKSIGSFGVFYPKLNNSRVGFHYVSADLIKAKNIKKGKKYKRANLFVKRLIGRSCNNFFERTTAFCIADFGAALFDMQIGSPIQKSIDTLSINSDNGTPISQLTRTAIYQYLSSMKSSKKRDSNDILDGLLNSGHFDDIQQDGTTFTKPSSMGSIVIIKGNNPDERQ